MNILKIEVVGYSKADLCSPIRKTFFVRDEAEFGERVIAWEKDNGIFEWSRTQRR